MTIGDLVVDRQTFSVLKGDRLLDLSATEFKLMLYLIEKKVFNREQLLSAVWKNDAYVEPRTVDVHIRRLRTQIGDHSLQDKTCSCCFSDYREDLWFKEVPADVVPRESVIHHS